MTPLVTSFYVDSPLYHRWSRDCPCEKEMFDAWLLTVTGDANLAYTLSVELVDEGVIEVAYVCRDDTGRCYADPDDPTEVATGSRCIEHRTPPPCWPTEVSAA